MLGKLADNGLYWTFAGVISIACIKAAKDRMGGDGSFARRGQTLNDDDREQWVDNDDGLYSWWKGERPRLSKRAFVRANRAEIDAHIISVRDASPQGRPQRAMRPATHRTGVTPMPTTAQIRTLSTEAAAAGDLRMAMIADLAVGGTDALAGAEPGTDAYDLLAEGMTQAQALALCDEAISDAAAR